MILPTGSALLPASYLVSLCVASVDSQPSTRTTSRQSVEAVPSVMLPIFRAFAILATTRRPGSNGQARHGRCKAITKTALHATPATIGTPGAVQSPDRRLLHRRPQQERISKGYLANGAAWTWSQKAGHRSQANADAMGKERYFPCRARHRFHGIPANHERHSRRQEDEAAG